MSHQTLQWFSQCHSMWVFCKPVHSKADTVGQNVSSCRVQRLLCCIGGHLSCSFGQSFLQSSIFPVWGNSLQIVQKDRRATNSKEGEVGELVYLEPRHSPQSVYVCVGNLKILTPKNVAEHFQKETNFEWCAIFGVHSQQPTPETWNLFLESSFFISQKGHLVAQLLNATQDNSSYKKTEMN